MRDRSAIRGRGPFGRPAALVMTCGLFAAGLTAGAIADGPPAAASGGILWVGGRTGSDANDNDCQRSATPCATISHALAKAQSGYHIRVAGPIRDNVIVPPHLRIVIDGSYAQFGDPAQVDGVNRAAPVFTVSPGSDVTLDRVLVIRKSMPGLTGGGIFNDGGHLTFLRGMIFGENAAQGAGIYAKGAAAETEVAYSSILDNRADYGGGIYNQLGSMVLNYTTVEGNRSSGTGGGIQSDSGYLRVFRSTVADNTSTGVGGGIDTRRVATPVGTRFAGYPDLEVTTSTISGNTASRGGGIADQDGLVENRASTISGNTAREEAGGIYNKNNLVRSTVPVIDSLATIVAENSGGNCAGSDRLASFASGGYNLTDDKTGDACGFTDGTDIVDANPRLGPLERNGGWTRTMMPDLSSPAVDKIPPAATFREALRHGAKDARVLTGFQACGKGAMDQRYRPRPLPKAIYTRCTIGAVETGPQLASVGIVKSGAANVSPGGMVTYTLRVFNDGPGYASRVVVTDPMSGYLTDISVSHASGCGVTVRRRVRCDFGTLAAGTGRTITVTARVAPRVRPGTTIENCGTVSTVTPETGSANRTSCVRTRTREVEVPVTG